MKAGLLKKHAAWWLWSARFIDLFLVAASGLYAYGLRFDWTVPEDRYWLAGLLVTLLAAGWFYGIGLYEPMRGKPYKQLLARFVWAWLGVWLVVFVIFFLAKLGAHYSRLWVMYWAACGAVVLLIYRLGLLLFLRWARGKGLNQRFIMLIGEGVLAEKIQTSIKHEISAGYQVVATFSFESMLKDQTLLSSLDQYGADEIWVAAAMQQESQIQAVLNRLGDRTENIRLIPDIFALHLLNYSISEVAGLPVLTLRETPMSGLNRFVKWCEDKVLASLILICISPILLVLAIAVKCSSSGPIFYRQERISWNNKKFMMLKFRSMPVDAEQATGAVWAKKGEQRATRIGAFMRRTSLDELPQFLNVLKGDMSIVGPRPERPVFVEQFKEDIPGYMQKHMMKAGITGWAQVNGWRGNTDLKKRIEYDLYYIEHWSLWLDIKIIVLTIFKGLINKNAY